MGASGVDGSRAGRAPVRARAEQYLIARNTDVVLPQGVEPVDINLLERRIANGELPGITLKKTLRPRGLALLADGMPGHQAIVVAEMPPEQADVVRQNPSLIVEVDHPLSLTMPTTPPGVTIRSPGVITPSGGGITVLLTVVGKRGAPITNADVYLYGRYWPVQGTTDAAGQVRLSLLFDDPGTLQALLVKPKADYWDLWIPSPALDPAGNNTVALTPLDRTYPRFPNEQVVGWGLKAMRVDQLPPNYRGQGIKIGVIDSGAATTHRDLRPQVAGGYDITSDSDRGWENDVIFHGTHCAGVIAGLDDSVGIRGVAPAAQVLAFKIFPGGRISDLIDALERCIEQSVDVVNLSLGMDQPPSVLLEQKLQRAKQLGIACIVAAGNSGGEVQYPASSPNVLAVAAIGKLGTFPRESDHGNQVPDHGPISSDGYFSPTFSCHGPQVGVCAPGVAILSSVPPDAFAVWDGTSMATPHVTGLAALILAHHPDFQGPYRQRNAQRVERLFDIIRKSATQLPELGDSTRTGAGLPDALRALNAQPAADGASSAELLQRLLATLQASGVQPAGIAPGVSVSLSQIGEQLRQVGLLAGAAAPTPSSVAGLPSLQDQMRQAGLLPGGRPAAAATPSAPAPRPGARTVSGHSAGPAGPDNAGFMQQLQHAMRGVGLLK